MRNVFKALIATGCAVGIGLGVTLSSPASATAGDRYITTGGWGQFTISSGSAQSVTVRCNSTTDNVISGGAKVVTSGGGDYDGVDFRQSYPFLAPDSSNKDGWTLRLVNSGGSTAYVTPQVLCEEG